MSGVDVDQCRALLKAAERGDAERVDELLKCVGVDVQFFEESQLFGPLTALAHACRRGHAEAARTILEYLGAQDVQLEQAFQAASFGGHVSTVKLLLERGVDPSTDDNQAFRFAAESGHWEVVQLLLKDARVDPADEGDWAIRFAAQEGHCEVVKILLSDPRVDPAALENYAVSWAAWNDHRDVLRVLLLDPRVDGRAAIDRAHPHALLVLLEDERCGIHVNRALFEQHHKDEVAKYDMLVEERSARISAVSWCMKKIGKGWGDLREPTEERMQEQPLDWDMQEKPPTGMRRN